MLTVRQGIQFVLAISLSASPLSASIRVIDETAIPYSSFLRKTEFDQRFPGESLTDTQNVASGWYIYYRQESLQYLFGPMPLQSTGQDYLKQLKEIVGEAVQQRPGIADHQLYLIKTPFDLSRLTKASRDNEEDSGTEAAAPAQSPPPSSGFWGMIKRWFGF